MARSDQQAEQEKVNKDTQTSLLSMENSHNSHPKKIVAVKDKWVKVKSHNGFWSCRPRARFYVSSLSEKRRREDCGRKCRANQRLG